MDVKGEKEEPKCGKKTSTLAPHPILKGVSHRWSQPSDFADFPWGWVEEPGWLRVSTAPAIVLRKKLQLQALPQAVAPLVSLQRRLIFTNHTRTARSKRNGRGLKIYVITQNICLRTVRDGRRSSNVSTILIKFEVIKATNWRCKNATSSTLLLLTTPPPQQ